MIVIIDFGLGNLRSVYIKIKRIWGEVIISSDIKEIGLADKLILPGVGNFASGMKNLNERKLTGIIVKKVLTQKTPILGICLGMQLLSTFSEEGNIEGLNMINARTIRFRIPDKDKFKLKIPHMGWNSVKAGNNSILLKNIPENSLFYFVHSYHLYSEDPDFLAGTSEYGYEFISLIEKGNVFGTQFHPEKSQDAGIQLLKNFIKI